MHLWLFLLTAATLAGTAHASIFCPHTAYPLKTKDDEFVVALIQSRERPGQESYYRITDDIDDPVYKRNSSRFRLLTTRDNEECPFKGCLVELSPVEPKNHATLLYQTSVIGKMIPPGFFATDVSRRLYCVVTDGDCGATIPIYRHYRWTSTDHAYSLESDTIVDGYIREPSPLCYVWPKSQPEEPPISDASSTLLPPLTDIIQQLLPKSLPTSPPPSERPASSHSNEDNALIDSEDLCEDADQKAFDSSMKKLREYYNGESGAKSDHWYSTIKPKGSYKPKALLGKIITDAKATNCKCLVQLGQMKFESEDKNVLDHKLVRVQIEPFSLYQYMPTGEELYCARKKGVCGATVPLRKFYNLADSDSMITANSEVAPPNSVPAPADILCWIWPKNYHRDSTEEELRKESMNLVTPIKSSEESAEVEVGSGTEPHEQQRNTGKVGTHDSDLDKTNSKKLQAAEKDGDAVAKKLKAEKPESKWPKIADKSADESSVEAEEQIRGDKILKFESENELKSEVKNELKSVDAAGKYKELPVFSGERTEDKIMLEADEERAHELTKFQGSKDGKEPREIKEQRDGVSTVLHFQDIAPKQ